ncbi:MAG: hypothetical protein FJ119_00260 [Deltaproteobacteria bacterium]|nr:hypothetical protein [Deltaproteobacteria bacterium]
MACVKKNPCPDCTFCQWCSDTRCAVCMGTCERCPKKTLQEQIDEYERNNPGRPQADQPILYKKTPVGS